MDDTYSYDGEQELVAVIPSQQNWKGIGISLLVILSVIGLVYIAVVILTPPDSGPRIKGGRITLENFTGGVFQTNLINTTWFSDSELAFIDTFGSLVVYNTVTGARRQIIAANVFKSLNTVEYSLSPDRSWALFKHRWSESEFSEESLYSLQKLDDGSNSPVLKVGITTQNAWDTQDFLQKTVWAGQPGGVVVVFKNDLYYRPEPLTTRVVRITDDGQPGVVFNGAPDWIYKKILGDDCCVWVSPDLDSVLYTVINSTGVAEIRFPQLINPVRKADREFFIKLPTAGGKIPSITLYLYSVKSGGKTEIQPPSLFENRSYYVESVSWVNREHFSVTWLSREQDVRIVSLCTSPALSCSEVLFQQATSAGLDTLPHNPNPPLFDRSLEKVAYIGMKLEGDAGTYPHLLLRAINDSVTTGPTFLTKGEWKVTKLLSWDHNNNSIYFIGSGTADLGAQHLYRHSLDGAAGQLSCISCSTSCLHTVPVLSPNSSYYIQHCLGPHIPFVQVISTETEIVIKMMDDNSQLQATIHNFSVAQTKLLHVKTDYNTEVEVQLKLPPGFREYEEFAFPLVLYLDSVYPSLDHEWKLSWIEYLASQKDYIMAKVNLADRRQSANESRLGMMSQAEILSVLRYLRSELHYVDSSKVGLVGERDGGYTAGMVLSDDLYANTEENSIIKCVVFISPTVDWRLSDAFTAENYFGSTKDLQNWSRYEASSLSSENVVFPNRRIYLTNRPGDLVSINHLLNLSRRLVQDGVIFKQQVYLDEHRLSNTMHHFYKSMESHLENCLGPVDDYFRDDYFLATIYAL